MAESGDMSSQIRFQDGFTSEAVTRLTLHPTHMSPVVCLKGPQNLSVRGGWWKGTGLFSALLRKMLVLCGYIGGHGTCYKGTEDPQARHCLQVDLYAHLTVPSVHPYFSSSSLAVLPLPHTLHFFLYPCQSCRETTFTFREEEGLWASQRRGDIIPEEWTLRSNRACRLQ